MTDNTKPEALDLADWLEAVGGGPSAKRCAALLREQHARIAELESELEAIGAGGVSGPLMGIAAPPTAQALGCGAEPPGIQALMCVISSLRDIAHFSDEEGGELMSALCALRDWAHAQPAPATQQAGEMEVFVLQWPGEDRINLSTVFDTEAEALDYMQNRCDTPGIRLVRFSSKAAHGPADGESK